MSLSKFGFKCGRKWMKTVDDETKNEQTEYNAYKERQYE